MAPPPEFYFEDTPVLKFLICKKFDDNSLSILQQHFDRAKWDNLGGTRNDRFFIVNMRLNNPSFYSYAGDMLRPVIGMINALHPRHRAYVIGALTSLPNNVRQAWHRDFNPEMIGKIPRHHIPFSVIITFGKGCLFVYKNQHGNIVELFIEPYSFVRFMGDVVHCGGENAMDEQIYRLFMYFAVSPAHIHWNGFFLEK